jgi:hypothetical protein
MNTAYTRIPLERLDEVRNALHARLKERTANTGERYDIRTFYFGKRSGPNRQYTLKRNATAAKIGVYESKDTPYGYSRFYNLVYYV